MGGGRWSERENTRQGKHGLCERLITRFLTATHFHFEARRIAETKICTSFFFLLPHGFLFNLCLLFCKEGLISAGHCNGDTHSFLLKVRSVTVAEWFSCCV